MKYHNENIQLNEENISLRNTILALNSEVCGAKLAAKYLDKELAGRIQQLQLLGREMKSDLRNKLWRQLESEILLQRHKTIVRACRRNNLNKQDETYPKLNQQQQQQPKQLQLQENDKISKRNVHYGDIRTVAIKRKPNQGLGLSITGGREHGVPILISELETNGPADLTKQLYIGDAIIFINNHDLRQVCHKEAVNILEQQSGNCTLKVQYITTDDSDTSLEEDYNFRLFDNEICSLKDSCNTNNLKNSLEMLNNSQRNETNQNSIKNNTEETNKNITNTNISPKYLHKNIFNLDNIEIINKNEITFDVKSLNDNRNSQLDNLKENRRNLNKLEDNLINKDENFNCSTNSLTSENISSPMQTSTDMLVESEIFSTDLASNESYSPKNPQNTVVCKNKQLTTSNESLINVKSDQSLLNSGESCGESPIHKISKDYIIKSQKKPKRKYFGVNTLQSIFSKHDYSDVSSTASDDNNIPQSTTEIINDNEDKQLKLPTTTTTTTKTKSYSLIETTPQFEDNVHNILLNIFSKNLTINPTDTVVNKQLTTVTDATTPPTPPPTTTTTTTTTTSSSSSTTTGTSNKKIFNMHGTNLRVGKALRLCPSKDFNKFECEQINKEKLLARYVYNSNYIGTDGVGDPDFGTPV